LVQILKTSLVLLKATIVERKRMKHMRGLTTATWTVPTTETSRGLMKGNVSEIRPVPLKGRQLGSE
jgi:hypothetical protein